MAVLQGIVSYPGVEQIVRASFTLSHGISPSTGIIELAPQRNIPAEVGDLIFRFGDTTIRFQRCRLVAPTFSVETTGNLASFQVQDRRWMWANGSISGRYNARKENGTVDLETDEPPQKLAAKLLEAMNESGFSVAELPNETRPDVEWYEANPAQELAVLCDSLGCRVVLGLDNRVRVCRAGVGAALPNLGTQMTEGYGATVAARPDALKFVAGSTIFESRLKLEAVGLDLDDVVRPIGDLEYKPSVALGEWGKQAPEAFGGVGVTLPDRISGLLTNEGRNRALQSVFRWYRPVLDDENRYPRIPYFEKLWQILPLLEGRLKEYDEPDLTRQWLPPEVTGIFYNKTPTHTNTDEASATGEVSRKYKGKFSVNAETGIVEFDEPVYKLDTTANTISEAELYLTIAYNFREFEDRTLRHYSFRQQLAGRALGTGDRIIHRPDIQHHVRAAYNLQNRATSFEENTEKLEREARFILQAAAMEFNAQQSVEVLYAGLVYIQPDGAIQQVSYDVGPGGAVTHASRNTEFDLAIPSYRERRRIERLKNAQATVAKIFGRGRR